MTTLDTEQKEELRHAALDALAVRAPAALAPRQVLNAVKKEIPFHVELHELVAALELLAGVKPEPLAEFVTDDLGATRYWRATSAGVLKAERDELR